MTKDEMKKRLDELGVAYNASADKGELAELLQANKGAAKNMVICRVRRDYWLTEDEMKAAGIKDDNRIRKGEIVEVDAMTALEGVERGMLERVK